MTTAVDRREVVLDIEGMTCASCVAKVQRALSGVEHVDAATVNLADRTATVDTDLDDVAPLVRAVEAVGYGAHAHSGERPAGEEARAYLRRTILAVALTAPVIVLTFVVPGWTWSGGLAWLLATPVVFVAGWPFIRSAVRAARHRTTTMDTLVALGSSAAYAYSVFQLLTGGDQLYFDTAAVIVSLILVGKTLEARARASAGDAARALLERGAKDATVLVDGAERRVPIDQVRPGDHVVVRPGEKIPADGVVKDGTSWVDLSMLTGESVPLDVGPGSEVVGASINGRGRLVVFVTKVGANTKLAEIVRLLRSAQATKAPVQRLADRVSSVFVPVVIGIAAATLVGWIAIAPSEPGQALLHAVAVLLIACPCALGLATPAAIMAGTGRAAELGVLFKGGEVFEAARRVDVALLDKTGTVTQGTMRLAAVVPRDGASPDELLGLAAAAETGSEHPIAAAVVEGARARGIDVPPATEHRIEPGAGAAARLGDRHVRVGRPSGLPPELTAEADRLAEDGLTTFGVWVDDRPIGLVGVSDEMKPDAADAVARLRAMGLDVAMVTGDRRPTAEAIARRVGIDRVSADMLPAQKVDEVSSLRDAGAHVVFVGDGINDAPALARADVGMAVGTGTDVAIAAADVTLMGGDVERIADALAIARKTYRVIAQNLFWAFGYNAVMIPLAVFGVLTPMWAAAAMAASSVSVVLNALRLRRFGRTSRTLDAR